jgi:hypothetical protein
MRARSARPPNISLTFKSAPERSEGLAWFVLFRPLTNHDKGFIRLKQLLGFSTFC